MRKLIFGVALLLVLLLAAVPVSADETYSYEPTEDGLYARFENRVDGYALNVPLGLSVDMRNSAVGAMLENEHLKIEIYKEYTPSSWAKETYTKYSNAFIKNETDHVVEYYGPDVAGEREFTVLAWNRAKLSRVENDKNYYLCIDIYEKAYTYTIYVKADEPLPNYGGYAYMAESFELIPATASSTIEKTSAPSVASRGWNTETADFFVNTFGEDEDLQWGMYEPNFDDCVYGPIADLEEWLDYEFGIVVSYTDFGQYVPYRVSKLIKDAHARGKALELTLQTKATSDGRNAVYDILNGECDTYLKRYAKAVAETGYPVLFRFGNEMNGDWCPYSAYNYSRDADLYVAAYKYIYEIFKAEKAKNVIWVWNPNSDSYPNYKWNHTMRYYPGDEYVDVVGLTAYNTGTYYTSVGETWKTFEQLYSNLYARYCAWFDQPFMITEFACAQAGGDKPAWITDMGARIKKMTRIKVAIWWNGADKDTDGTVSRSYYVTDSEEAIRAFRNVISPWRIKCLG